MKRLSSIVVGSLAVLAIGLVIYFQVLAAHGHGQKLGGADDDNSSPALSNVTVSFGGWMTDPPLDRFPDVSPITANHHELSPRVAKIRAGGTVNFIISGFHQVIVYDDGTRPQDINTSITVPPTSGGPPLIADPDDRIYRGLDPSLFPLDRVEVVQFNRRGTYLVICGVSPHFAEGMFGFVRVVGAPGDVSEASE